jgi:hypothetical protein
MATEKMVEEMVKICIRHLRKKKYELNLPKSAVDDAISHLHVYKRRNGTSNAGLCCININIANWQMGNKAWNEYDSYNNDPVIGRIEVSDNKDILLCLVAHEVSHYVQYTFRNWFPEYLKKDYRKPHGRTFQKIYRYLRADLVNPTINKKLEKRNAA